MVLKMLRAPHFMSCMPWEWVHEGKSGTVQGSLHTALCWMEGFSLFSLKNFKKPNLLGRPNSAISLLANRLHQCLYDKGYFPLNVHAFRGCAFVTSLFLKSWEQPWEQEKIYNKWYKEKKSDVCSF